jgi:hypothetical protein
MYITLRHSAVTIRMGANNQSTIAGVEQILSCILRCPPRTDIELYSDCRGRRTSCDSFINFCVVREVGQSTAAIAALQNAENAFFLKAFSIHRCVWSGCRFLYLFALWICIEREGGVCWHMVPLDSFSRPGCRINGCRCADGGAMA